MNICTISDKRLGLGERLFDNEPVLWASAEPHSSILMGNFYVGPERIHIIQVRQEYCTVYQDEESQLFIYLGVIG